MKMSSKEASTVMATVKAQTNIQWRQEANQAFIITGSLTEIQNAHKCLLEILEQRVRSPQSSDLHSYSKKPSLIDVEETTASVNHKEDVNQDPISNGFKDPLQPVMYETEAKFGTYLSRFYKKQLTDIEQEFHMRITWEKQGSQIILNPLPSCNAHTLRDASKAFVNLYQQVHTKVSLKHFCLENSSGDERKVILNISKEFAVLIERSEDRTRWAVYGEEESVGAALNELSNLKAITVRLESPTRAGTGGRSDESDDQTTEISGGKSMNLEKVLPGNVKVSVYQREITEERVGAIVNAANERLQHEEGVALAISGKGGPIISRESEDIIQRRGWLHAGEAVHSSSGNLPCQYVIHAVVPRKSSQKLVRIHKKGEKPRIG